MRTIGMAALALLCWAGTARAAALSDYSLVFGTGDNNWGPKSVMVTSSGAFTVELSPGPATDGRPNVWHRGLTITPLSGTGPRALSVKVDKCWAPPSTRAHTSVRVCDAKGCSKSLDVRVSTSSDRKFGACLGIPTAAPTPRATVVPPPATIVPPVGTIVPTARPTVPIPVPTFTTAPPSGQPNCRANPTTPVRYTCAQVGLALERTYDKSNMFKWDPVTGCRTTEYQRRMADSTRLVCLRKLLVYLESVGPRGKKLAREIDQRVWYNLKAELAGYVLKSLKDALRPGHWSIDDNGFYGHSSAGGQDGRYATQKDKDLRAEIARAGGLPTEHRLFLDMAPDTTVPSEVLLPPMRPDANDDVQSRLGMIQTHLPRVRPSQACLDANEAAHACHAQASRFQCGNGAAPTCNTQELHLQAAVICGRDCGEECANIAALRAFYATPDYDDPTTPEKDGWTQEEVCDWFTIADEHHHAWFKNVLAWQDQFSWAKIERDDEDHSRDHDALVYYTDTKYQWSCNGGFVGCPQQTPLEYLRAWQAKHPKVATSVQALSAEQPRIAAKVIDGTAAGDVLDPSPAPTPTHVRVDNRPSATPIPGQPRMVADPIAPVTLPAKVAITVRRVDAADKIFGIRVWFKTPTQSTQPKTPSYCAKIARLSRTRTSRTITCNLSARAPRGPWKLCLYIPDEPGRAFGGLDEGCQTVDVR